MNYEAQLTTNVHAGNQRCRKHETQIRFRQKLPITRVQTQQFIRKIPRASGSLGGCMDTLNPEHDLVD